MNLSHGQLAPNVGVAPVIVSRTGHLDHLLPEAESRCRGRQARVGSTEPLAGWGGLKFTHTKRQEARKVSLMESPHGNKRRGTLYVCGAHVGSHTRVQEHPAPKSTTVRK